MFSTTIFFKNIDGRLQNYYQMLYKLYNKQFNLKSLLFENLINLFYLENQHINNILIQLIFKHHFNFFYF